MNNTIEVIGIDHSCSQMKTRNTCFNTSIKELVNTPAFHDNVLVYPQCYAAVAGMLPTFGKKAIVIDVGSWTVDSMLIVNKKPDNNKCDTQNKGLIKCMRAIN